MVEWRTEKGELVPDGKRKSADHRTNRPKKIDNFHVISNGKTTSA